MRFLVMFVTAVCVLFLIKLRWPKKKNFLILKALISEVTVEQQILALVCYVLVALIKKIAKRIENINFRLRPLARSL